MALQISLSPSSLRPSPSSSSPASSSGLVRAFFASPDQPRALRGVVSKRQNGGAKANRIVTVRSSLEIAGPTVGQVTEVCKDTFWPLVKASGSKIVVLDMYTQWCGPCKVIAPKFKELSEKYLDVVFLKLDCNQENKTLAKELGIRVVPTFKILKDGNIVKEVTGAKFDDLVFAIDTVKSSC
ncbi:thioredoxin F-type, chloroplastic-like [Dioscorea cayenensis subsp. rotundata]|uniref:Thioredoxin F-type, chloroplastic-like n=1 Tax=Dioscorea cayennensis subsp. rotundata TaxID=55577 RepID=A0AB40CI47_DIOCR|nr:thioredoxin F-type, chloroplastic-like [Dioscorea cayenensis subsp. rotundata]